MKETFFHKSLSAYAGFQCLGISLATVISWETNKSIAWSILQGGLGWLYVIYYAVFD